MNSASSSATAVPPRQVLAAAGGRDVHSDLTGRGGSWWLYPAEGARPMKVTWQVEQLLIRGLAVRAGASIEPTAAGEAFLRHGHGR